LAERMHHLGPLEHPGDLPVGGAVADEGVLEDLAKAATAIVLSDDVGGDPLLLRRAGEEKRERILEEAAQPRHGSILWSGRARVLNVKRHESSAVFAQRVLEGVDDAGVSERVVIWIERKPGAVWAVGRAINPQHRQSEDARPDDYVFEGYELEDALECANATLDDDARVSAQDGRLAQAEPFVREELLKPLERWFFGH
jgi:hypothetical protein